ncbi:hypothetical protein [Pseudomonas sp. 5P_3.1_Bac2]|uniref:PA4575 family protein n=1 Tax=Pseudomonas sp. 5P_3.1_Bac2 TaxID=2971617 RepID=UPI0021CAB811|nr:hypothetical protein [Pseudomonas sp. 5P_3.1_Bac2]MCU1718173.1 hypothetical protein [Pseudomonas sp. 5P_3.1_Bac2]
MPRSLVLIRHCLVLDTRIEFYQSPYRGHANQWLLLCAAGISAEQPSLVKVQGPFFGACSVDQMLGEIVQNLLEMGYEYSAEPPIWRLHMQAQLRALRGPPLA